MGDLVLLTDHPWAGVDIEREVLGAAGAELAECPPGATPEQVLALCSGAAAIMTCWAPVTRAMVEAAPGLQVVARMGVGLDNIDRDAAAERDVVVTNVPDYCVEEVSDHVVALVHAWARGIVRYDRSVRGGDWLPAAFPLRRVSELTVGVLGLGRIGARTAAKMSALGCRVLGHDPAGAAPGVPVTEVARDVLLAESDVVTVHVPLLPATHHLVDAAFLAAMRQGALLVNVSRGGLADTAAVTAALGSGHLGGAALDVLENEPEIPSELIALDGAIVTPHVAFLSATSVAELRRRAAEDVADVLRGRAPRNAVRPPARTTMGGER